MTINIFFFYCILQLAMNKKYALTQNSQMWILLEIIQYSNSLLIVMFIGQNRRIM